MEYNTYLTSNNPSHSTFNHRNRVSSYESVTISNSPSSWVEEGFADSNTSMALNHNIASVNIKKECYNNNNELDIYNQVTSCNQSVYPSMYESDLYYTNTNQINMLPNYYNNNMEHIGYMPAVMISHSDNSMISPTQVSFPMNEVMNDNTNYYSYTDNNNNNNNNTNLPLIFNHDLRGRAENWNHEETSTFIGILLTHSHQFQNIRRYPGLWNVIKQSMETKGYKRSIEKCKNRWKVLVAKYKKCHMEIMKQNNMGKKVNPNFEFFYPIQQLLYPNYSFGQNGIQRKFKTPPKPKSNTNTTTNTTPKETKNMSSYLFPYAHPKST